MRLHPSVTALLCGLTFATLSAAQEPGPAKPVPPAAASVQQISPGVFQVGLATLRQEDRTVSFPGAVCLDSGLLEYLLVTPEGPTHESLLTTDLKPADLHVAMLLLGARGTPSAQLGEQPPGQITAEYLKTAPQLAGDTITITVTWKSAAGQSQTVPVETWLAFGERDQPASPGPWLYTGSRFGYTTGQFMAQAEGLHAALVTNPAALINNPREGHHDDRAWSVRKGHVPPATTPVQIELRLLTPAPPSGK